MRLLCSIVLMVTVFAGPSSAQTITLTVNHEIDGSSTALGKFQVLESDQTTVKIPWRSPGAVTISQNTSYWLETKGDDDVIDKIDNGSVYKHRTWDWSVSDYMLKHQFTSGTIAIDKTAEYKSVLETVIYNNFEESTQEGVVFFHDPWYVTSSGEQPDDLVTDYREKDSPHTPYGNENEDIEGGVFREMEILFGKPYYRTKHNTYLDADMVQTATLPLDRGEYVLQGIFARDRDDADVLTEHGSSFWSYTAGDGWEAASSRYANLKFLNDGSEVYGYYKCHLMSINEADAPTRGNSQRKVVTQHINDAYRHHAVYESGGKIYYTYSADTGATWQPEILISDYYHECKRPSIAFRDEYGSSHESPAVYITYVDSTASVVMLRYWQTKSRPDIWATIDSIQISAPFICNPVVATVIYEAKSYEVLAYEGSDSTLNMSMYLATTPLTATRISGDFTGMTSTADYSFRDRILATSYQNWRNRTIAPRFPSIVASQFSTTGDFSIVWMETWNGSMKIKGLMIEDVSQTTQVTDTVAHYVQLNRIVATENARPSLSAWHEPFIAYQCDMASVRQIPTWSQNWPYVLGGRSYLQLSSRYPSTPAYSSSTRDNVALRRGYGAVGATYAWHPVTPVASLPRQVGEMLEPSLGPALRKISISVNTGWDRIGVINLDYSLPAKVGYIIQTDGRYPALSPIFPPLQLYSGRYGFASPNSQGPPVLGSQYYWEVINTTHLLAKTKTAYEDRRMRQLVLTKNDSSYVAYGMTMPSLVENGDTYTTLSWDYSKDTTGSGFWNELSGCVKTAPFTVPSNAAFEYGATLYAENPDDFDDTVIVALQVCIASNDSVLTEFAVTMSEYDVDSVSYVLDRIDLSLYDGSQVYFQLDYSDSTDAESYDVLVVQFIDSVATEKDNRAVRPSAQNITLLPNYPNPFNPQTMIPFSLESAGHVTLKVHDVRGSLVATLIDRMMPQGYNVTGFDGSTLPTGTYLVKLRQGDTTVSRQMLLIK